MDEEEIISEIDWKVLSFELEKDVFDTNYIFYRVPYHSININDDKTESFKNILDKFVNKDEINNYTEVTERDKHLKELIDRYKKW